MPCCLPKHERRITLHLLKSSFMSLKVSSFCTSQLCISLVRLIPSHVTFDVNILCEYVFQSLVSGV